VPFQNDEDTDFPQESDDPMAYIHFTAEGEVTFKSILFVPTSAPRGLFDEYGSKKSDYIKVGFYVVCGEFKT
jgi:heat shock protein beta